MTSPSLSPHDLAHAIECLVAAYVDEGLRTAQLAIARSLASGASRSPATKVPSATKAKKRKAPSARRSAEELVRLEEKLYEHRYNDAVSEEHQDHDLKREECHEHRHDGGEIAGRGLA